MRWSAGRADEALALYDARVWGEGSSENLSLCNDISMLARLELADVDVGGRWDAVADVVREQAGGSVLAFVDAQDGSGVRAPRVERDGGVFRVLVGSSSDRDSAVTLARELERLLERPATVLLR